MSNVASTRQRGVQSVEVSIQVLKAVAAARGPIALSDLSIRVGMPAAKVHRYLVSLIESQMIVQRGSGSYDLGPAAAEIGVAAVARIDVVNRAADGLPDLVDATGCTAMLSVFGSMGPTIVRWERTYPPLITALGVGSVLPVLRSATGHVFLTWLPDRMVAPFIEAESTGNMQDEVERIRKRVRPAGMAEAKEIYIPGLFALAGPVLDLQGQAQAAVTLISTERSIVKRGSHQRSILKEVLKRGR